jgi:hypothetical protein
MTTTTKSLLTRAMMQQDGCWLTLAIIVLKSLSSWLRHQTCLLLHQGKMDAEHATVMWSDADVGMTAQHVIMQHLVGFFGNKFIVPEAAQSTIWLCIQCHQSLLWQSTWTGL